MKSAQAKRRHAESLRLRAAELRRRVDRITPYASRLTIVALVQEARRAALALEAAAELVDGALVDDLNGAEEEPESSGAPIFKVIKHPSSGRAQDKRTREDE